MLLHLKVRMNAVCIMLAGHLKLKWWVGMVFFEVS